LALSGQWLCGLALVWVTAASPWLRGLVRGAWPEQLGLVALLGWYLAGVTLVVLVLAALGVLGRSWLLWAGLRRRLGAAG
jgi:hypothetical protein